MLTMFSEKQKCDLKISTNTSAMRSVSILVNATASGYRVALSIIVSIYRDFLSDRGSIGPTMSTATLLNGVSINGNFPNGILVILPF